MVDLNSVNSEAEFVFKSVSEFMKAWSSSKEASLSLETKNGKTWVNFSCCLGHPGKMKKPKTKSKKKRERDNLRAQLYQQRLHESQEQFSSTILEPHHNLQQLQPSHSDSVTSSNSLTSEAVSADKDVSVTDTTATESGPDNSDIVEQTILLEMRQQSYPQHSSKEEIIEVVLPQVSNLVQRVISENELEVINPHLIELNLEAMKD